MNYQPATLNDEVRLSFQQFKPSGFIGRRGSSTPTASIAKQGTVRFNKAAKERFGLSSDTTVTVYYSEVEKILAIKKCHAGTDNSIKFHNSVSGEAMFGAGELKKVFNLKHEAQSNLLVTVDRETGMILIHGVEQQPKTDMETFHGQT